MSGHAMQRGGAEAGAVSLDGVGGAWKLGKPSMSGVVAGGAGGGGGGAASCNGWPNAASNGASKPKSW